MDFSLTDEQQLIIKSTREFVERELYPHEAEIERTGVLRDELQRELKAKAIEAGLYAANMPADVGGGGLDTVTLGAVRKGAGPHQLRAALQLRGPAVQHPARAARASSASATCCRPCAASASTASR